MQDAQEQAEETVRGQFMTNWRSMLQRGFGVVSHSLRNAIGEVTIQFNFEMHSLISD